MKYLSSFLFVAVLSLLGGIGAWALSSETVEEKSYEMTLFMTVLSSDEDSSIQEKETAAHFFAEAVLGWTLSPAFTEELNFSLFSRKQERGNIVFQFSSESPDELKKMQNHFQRILEKKLSHYNSLANTQFSLLLDNPVIEEKTPKKSFWTMGGLIAGFFLGLFLLEGWKFFRRKQ